MAKHDTSPDNFVYRLFHEQLSGYYGQYLSSQRGGLGYNSDDPLRAAIFVEKVNQNIGDEKEKIDVAKFREFLSGDSSPSIVQVRAIAVALTPEVNLFGDIRDNFIESAGTPGVAPRMPASEDDETEKEGRIAQHGRAISAQESRMQEHDARLREHKAILSERENLVAAWKRTNPKDKADKKSFGEMVEDACRAGISFKPFLENVLAEWDISPDGFCAHMEKLNSQKQGMAKKTLTNSVLYQWMNHPEYLPNAASILLLRETFGLDEQRELMLWKVIGGRKIDNLDAMIDSAEIEGNHGTLVKALVDASGIPDVHIQRMVGVSQLPHWKHGAIVEKKQAARRFVDLVHPPESLMDQSAHEQNRRILGLITRRPQSMEEAIDAARDAAHPGGALMLQLTGRYGLVSLSDDELAEGLSVKANQKKKIEADTVTIHKVSKMRCSTHLQRGGYIHERHAGKILDMVQAQLKEEGSNIKITPEEREECLEMMTGIANVEALFGLCRGNALTANELLRMTRDRRGLTQEQAEQEIGLSSISGFECGKTSLQHESARKVAEWLGLEDADARDFVVMATGKQYDLTPHQLLEQAKADPKQRCRFLRRIFDATGLTREELAEKSGIDYNQIMYAVQTRSGGRIVADDDAIINLARICGFGDKVMDFHATFGGSWVERTGSQDGKTSKESNSRIPRK